MLDFRQPYGLTWSGISGPAANESPSPTQRFCACAVAAPDDNATANAASNEIARNLRISIPFLLSMRNPPWTRSVPGLCRSVAHVTRLTPNRPDVIEEAFGDEVVLVNLRTGRYYSLEGSAGPLWKAIGDGAGPEQVAAAADAPVDAVIPFLTQLVDEQLVVVEGDQLPPHAGAGLDHEAKLLVFNDMEDILQLDPIHDIDLDGTGWPSPA